MHHKPPYNLCTYVTCKKYIYIFEKLEATELWEKEHKVNISGWENWKAIWGLINKNTCQISDCTL